jgi:hypothetical protein
LVHGAIAVRGAGTHIGRIPDDLVNRRRRSSETWVFALAFLGSLALHLPLYGGLGYLAKLVGPKGPPEATDRLAEVELTFEDGLPEPSPEPRDDDPPPSQPAPERRENDAPTPADPRLRRPQPTPAAQPPSPQPTPEQTDPRQQPPRPPEDPAERQAIQQRSDDPDVAPPPDARYISEQNRRVDEETVARLRNYARDDAELSPGRPETRTDAPELGNADETDVEDARDVEGSDARRATEREARAPRPERSPTTPPEASPTRGAAAQAEGRAAADGRAGEDSGGEAASPGGAPSTGEPLVVDDGHGRFVIAMPRQGRGEDGPGADGPHRDDGRRGRGRAGDGRRSGAPGDGGGRGQGRGRTSGDLDLQVSWANFEQVYGRERLAEERRTFIEERRTRMRGQSGSTPDMNRFRAAIENYVPNVRPGNQTALNAAASPFANYLAGVHRRIHREFADRYLASLPSWGDDPHADRTLMTKLEIILNQDGSVHRVGVVRTSGLITFDYGAYRAVMRGQPYPAPPSSILSGDGRVYFHWGFYRNERQCGTFNAQPYILPHPPGSGDQREVPDGLRDDGPEQGGVIPAGSRPTWGTGREGDGGSSSPRGDPGDGTEGEGRGTGGDSGGRRPAREDGSDRAPRRDGGEQDGEDGRRESPGRRAPPQRRLPRGSAVG